MPPRQRTLFLCSRCDIPYRRVTFYHTRKRQVNIAFQLAEQSIQAKSRIRNALRRRMVEVRGVEPLSEMESAKLLRVYPAIGLGRGTPTSGLIPFHPLGSAPCSGRTEPPAACPARLCRGGSAGVGRATCGNYLGRESVIAVRNYLFSRFLTRPTRILDARSDLNSSRRNRITPSWLVRVLYHKFRCRAPSEPRPTPR